MSKECINFFGPLCVLATHGPMNVKCKI